MEYSNKSKEELVEEIFNLKDTVKNISLDYDKTLLIIKEIQELCVKFKARKGLFKLFAIGDAINDILKILESKK